MAAHDPVQHGVSLALEAHRRKLLDDRCLDAILQYYDAEGARDPFPAAEVLARVGGLSEEALRSLFAGPAPSPSDVQGEKFGDRLTLLDQVGEGGMGTVFRAYDRVLKRGVAVKRLRIDHLDGKGAAKVLARFEREAHAMARVRHPACVQIFDAGLTPKGEPYLVMEFVAGKSLRALIEESYGHDAPRDHDPLLAPVVPPPARRARPLDPHTIARLGASLAEALQACHDVGLVHRDVKPANILLDAQGTPRLTDFGVALDDQARTKLTVDRAMVGTLAYMAPEQALGERVDARCDVYALGVTLYEALAGEPPHDAGAALVLLRQVLSAEPAALHTHRRDVPRDLETIIHKCLAKAAADRYATAQALALDLRRFLADEPVLAQPVSGVQRLARRAWRARRWVGGGVMVAVVGMIALGVARVRTRENARAEIESALAAAAIASDLDAAEARVLPLIAVAEPDQAERGREALRLVRGRRRLREAEVAFVRWQDATARANACLEEADSHRETVDPQEPYAESPGKKRIGDLEGEHDVQTSRSSEALVDIERALAQASVDLTGPEVDGLRARVLLARARELEDDPTTAESLFKEAETLDVRSGSVHGQLLALPTVVVDSDPPGNCRLSRYAFDPGVGHMVPTEVARGATRQQLEGTGAGEYLLEVEAEDHLPARFLLRLTRGERRSVRVALMSRRILGPLADLVVHVPAGEARWGSGLRSRALVDEFFMQATEMPVEVWLSFFIAQNPGDAFRPYVPASPDGRTGRPGRTWPVSGVSWDEIQVFLRWFQAEVDRARLPFLVRLPAPPELHRALRGEFAWLFPWGRRLDPSFCLNGEGTVVGDMSALSRRTDQGMVDRSGLGVLSLVGVRVEFTVDRDTPCWFGGDATTSATLLGDQVARHLPVMRSAESPCFGFRSVLVSKPATAKVSNLDDRRVDELADLARRLYLDRRLAEAFTTIDQAVDARPLEAAFWNSRGLIRHARNDPWGAVWDFTMAFAVLPLSDPRQPILFTNRGLAQLDRGALSEAVADLTQALERSPGLAEAWAGRAQAWLQLGEHDRARSDADEALRLNQTHAGAKAVREKLAASRR